MIRASSFNVVVTRFARLFSILMLLSLAVKCWVDVDWAWDSWNYHFLMAASFWRLIPEGSYLPDPMIQLRMQIFPGFGEWLQGALWALSHRIQGANFVAYFSLLGFLFFLRRTFNIPFYASTVALLAVPFIQIHSSICHVDFLGNVCLSIFLLLLYRLYSDRETFFTPFNLSLLTITGIAAPNIKSVYLMLVMPLFVVASIGLWRGGNAQIKVQRVQTKHRVFLLTGLLIAFVIIFAVPIRNFAQYGNAFYGTKVQFGSWKISEGYDFQADYPVILKKSNNMQRWLYSLAEINRPAFYWTYDQHYPVGPVEDCGPGDFMGGYFNVLVLFECLLFPLLLFRRRKAQQPILPLALSIAGLTLVTGFLPQSCLLRYYMYWIMILITLNLTLIIQLTDQKHLSKAWLPGVTLIHIALFTIVASATHWQHILPQGQSLDVLQSRIDHKPFPQFQSGHTYCLRGVNPFALLYSEGFQTVRLLDRHYVIEDAGWPPKPIINTTWPILFDRTVTEGACNAKSSLNF